MTTKTALTLETLKARWIGRDVYGSTDHQLDSSGRHPRPVTEVYYSAEFDQYIAYAGEHHKAASIEALDRRLQSLAVRG